MIIKIKDLFQSLIEKELKNNKQHWQTGIFSGIKNLSIDQRGRIGEHFLRDIFEELNMKVHYIDNKHGDYDLEVNGYKIEVKLATLDVNDKFQHEGIKKIQNEIWLHLLMLHQIIYILHLLTNINFHLMSR